MIKNLIFDFGKVLVDYEYFETLDQIFTVFCKDVAGNHRLVALEQVAHVGEGKPHGFVLQADFEAGLSVGGLVEEEVGSHNLSISQAV